MAQCHFDRANLMAALGECRYVAIWITLSATVILYNKYILTWGMFPYPVALTMWHMGFCSVLAFGIVRGGYVQAEGMSPETYLKYAASPHFIPINGHALNGLQAL